MSSASSICSKPKRWLMTATILTNSCWKSSLSGSLRILAKDRPDLNTATLVENGATVRQSSRLIEIVSFYHDKTAQAFADLDKWAVGDDAPRFQNFAFHGQPLAAAGHPALRSYTAGPVLPFLGQRFEFLRRDVGRIVFCRSGKPE